MQTFDESPAVAVAEQLQLDRHRSAVAQAAPMQTPAAVRGAESPVGHAMEVVVGKVGLDPAPTVVLGGSKKT